MKGITFQDALASSTRVIGREQVRVVFGGADAHTDGNTVTLPSVPAMAEVNHDQAQVIRGYRDHEALHVRCTDTSKPVLQELKLIEQRSKGAHKFVQFAEDIRIESAGVQEYAGTAEHLGAVNSFAASQLKEKLTELAQQHGITVEEVFKNAPLSFQAECLLPSIARHALGIDCGFYKELWDMADPRVLAFAKQAADRMRALPTGVENGRIIDRKAKLGTAESMKLGQQLFQEFQVLEQEPPPPPPPPQQGDDSDEQDGDCSSDGQGGAGKGQGQGGGRGQAAAISDATDSGGDSKGGRGSGGSIAQPGGQPQQVPKFDMPDLPTGYEQALQQVVEEINESAGVPASEPGDDPIIPWREFSNEAFLDLPMEEHVVHPDWDATVAAGMMRKYQEAYASILAAVGPAQAMIRRTLEQELQARMDRVWQPGHKSGRLNSGRLVDAVRGREDVYRRRQDGKDIDTLLRLSADGSGSMGSGEGSKRWRAAVLAVALAQALERTGCDIEIEQWSCSFSHSKLFAKVRRIQDAFVADRRSRQDPHTGEIPPIYTSVGHAIRARVKGRKDRMADAATQTRLGMLANGGGGGTPMIEVVTRAVAEMAKLQYGKRILMLLTDGEPNGVQEGSEESRDFQMRKVHEYAARNGVHIIALGIGTSPDMMKRYFADFECIDDNAEMLGPVIRKLAKYLAQERTNALRPAA